MSTSLINFSQAVSPALFLSLSNPARVEILAKFQNDIVENNFGSNLETTDDNTNLDFSLSTFSRKLHVSNVYKNMGSEHIISTNRHSRRRDFWILKSWVEFSFPHYLPSCPGRGGVNSTQLFGPMNTEQLKNLTSGHFFCLCLSLSLSLSFSLT